MADNEKPVTKLSEVIGGLVASVAHARSVADAEALRIAHRYRQHELLRGLPVPRLRLRRVSISLPVVLSEVIAGTPAELNTPEEIARVGGEAFAAGMASARTVVNDLARLQSLSEDEKEDFDDYRGVLKTAEQLKAADVFRQVFQKELEQMLVEQRIAEAGGTPIDSGFRDAVGQAAESAFTHVMKEIVYRWVQDLVEKRIAASTMSEPFNPERARKSADDILDLDLVKDFLAQLRQAAQQCAVRKPTIAPDFSVSVNTDNIKNTGGGPDAVTRLNLVLLEEGLEWMSETRSDGTETTKLTLE